MSKGSNKDDDKSGREKFDDLMNKMNDVKQKWDEEKDSDDEDDKTSQLLDQAIEMAIEQGRGWSPGEKEAYLNNILDDDFIPPMFANTAEEVENSGLAEAFTSLKYDDTPTQLMLNFKKMGNESFANGKRNEVNNMQYFRDAINHYHESFAWAQKVEPMLPGDLATVDNDDPTYTEQELDAFKATICCNIALAHVQLKNWGFVRDESKKALAFDATNVKAWYRLAKAHQMLQNWEEAGDAIDKGLEVDEKNADLKKLNKLLAARVQRARKLRQERERKRAERVLRVKQVWKHCKEKQIQLGRVPLVATVTDDEETEEDESKWHHHRPNSGKLAEQVQGEWTWPVLFLYPSHKQSDFVRQCGESEMLALRTADMFPELEDGQTETAAPWDHNNEFVCSKLAIYFEVHCSGGDSLVHPEFVSKVKDQGDAMRFYEASRALLGDEGEDMANVARAVERKNLYQQRKAWKRKHGSLWSKPDPCPVVRVHPAITLQEVLTDKRMVVPNFLVTLIMIPEDHPAHEAFLKEHKCIDIIQPKSAS